MKNIEEIINLIKLIRINKNQNKSIKIEILKLKKFISWKNLEISWKGKIVEK